MRKSPLFTDKCVSCEGGAPRLKPAEITSWLKCVNGWKVKKGSITKTFLFKNYYETTSFVSAAVWIAHQEDHHPDILFGYKKCEIVYSTHSVKGLTKNDFICAAKINALFSEKGQT